MMPDAPVRPAVTEAVVAVKTPLYRWTNGGSEVFILRFVNKDGSAYGGFKCTA